MTPGEEGAAPIVTPSVDQAGAGTNRRGRVRWCVLPDASGGLTLRSPPARLPANLRSRT
jgi:hypothetical protein